MKNFSKALNFERIPLNLAKIYSSAKMILNSNIVGSTISMYSGVNHTTISRLRKHRLSLKNSSMITFLLLANYPNKRLAKVSERDFKTIKLQCAFTSMKHFHVSLKSIQKKIDWVTHYGNNTSQLSRSLQIPRIKIVKLKHHYIKGVNLLNLKFQTIIRILTAYNTIKHNEIRIRN